MTRVLCLCVCTVLMSVFDVYGNLVIRNTRGSFRLERDTTQVGDETIREVQRFRGVTSGGSDHFKTVMIEGAFMVIGARNMIYNISLGDLRERWNIKWSSSEADKQLCVNNQKSEAECENYIRVIQLKSEHELFVCGTNAYKPYCRTYHIQEFEDGSVNYFSQTDQIGNGRCPYDPKQNNTALFVGERLYSATAADRQSRDALIYGSPMDNPDTNPQLPPTLRTQQYDSQWLNEPNHVHSFEYDDKVYFMFSEMAVEYINCGKKIFSRVGRVCKNDQGGKWVLRNTWTSFFKARLNCSLPGDFPYYFDEIQSASDIGRGNYMPSISPLDNNTDMFYAVFNTPQNSIHGSAVCAFRMSDVLRVFEGAFKEQKQPNSNWLPVSEMDTPHPHPAKTCSNDSLSISDQTLNFIKTHPLMDGVVPSFGAQPVFTQASSSYRLTKIAIDWQVHAADGRYYDVIYIGTDDGRVIKTINKGTNAVEQVVVEDIEVFHDKAAVVNIRVYRNEETGEEKLIVVSANEVKAIPLQRCHLHDTCSNCVLLQDPYCSWNQDRCMYSRQGKQSISTGMHHECTDPATTPPVLETTPTTCPPCPTCQTATSSGNENIPVTPNPNMTDSRMMNTIYEGPAPTQTGNDIPVMGQSKTDPKAKKMQHLKYTAGEMAFAVIFSIIISLVVGAAGAIFLMRLLHRRKSQRQHRANRKFDDNNLAKKTATLEDNTYNQIDIKLKKHPNTPRTENQNHPIPNGSSEAYVPNYSSNSLKSYPETPKPLNNHKVFNDLKSGKTVNENIEPPKSPSRKVYI